MTMFMLKIQEGLRKFVANEKGQDLVEYALLVSLVALAAIAATRSVASAITTVFNNISTSLT